MSSPPTTAEDWREDLRLVARALRASGGTVADDPHHLAGQLIGRLLRIDRDAVRSMVDLAGEYDRRPWLRPLTAGLADPAGPLIVSLRGQGDEITAVAISQDGRVAASGSHPLTVKIWDVERGSETHALGGSSASTEGNIQEVKALAINSAATRVGAGYEAGGFDVWTPTSGKHVKKSGRPDEDTIWRCAVSSNARWGVSAFQRHYYFDTGRSDTIEVWDLERGKLVHELKGKSNALAITPDGRRFIASAAGGLQLWDLTRGTARRIVGPSGSALTITPDGRRAVMGHGDGSLTVWDLSSTEEPRTIAGHGGSVTSVAITADGTRAFSGSTDSTVRLWDLERPESIRQFVAHAGAVSSVAITADGHRGISGGRDKVVRVWDLETEAKLARPPHHGPVESIRVTGDGRHAVSEGDTRIGWNLDEARRMPAGAENELTPDPRPSGRAAELIRSLEQDEVQADNHKVTAIAVSEDQTRGICIVHASNTVSAMHRWFEDRSTLRVWELGDHPVGHVLATENRSVVGLHDLAFGTVDVDITRDGRYAVTAADDHTVTLWDLDARRPVAGFTGDSPMRACGISPDGQTVIAGDDGGEIHLLRVTAWS